MNLKSMSDTVTDLKTFLGRADVPTSQIMDLLGKQRPSTGFSGIVLAPHDKRFLSVVIYADPRDSAKLFGIAFSCPDNPVNLGELQKEFGNFEAKYRERDNMSIFVSNNFEEGSVLESFIARMEDYQFENAEDGDYAVTMEDGNKYPVPASDIFVDFFRFNFIDREPVPDQDAAKNVRQDPMAVLRSRMAKKIEKDKKNKDEGKKD